MKLVLSILPESVTPEIVRACGSLRLNAQPVFVPIVPARHAVVNKCILNVRSAEQIGAGTCVLGWKIYHWPGVLVQFIGHAILAGTAGELTCITPDREGESRVLFIRDESITFDGDDPLARMPHKRVASNSHRDVAEYIEIEERILAIKCKHPPTAGLVSIEGDDAIRLGRLEVGKRRRIRDIVLRTRKSTQRCICDSGRQFGSCCEGPMRREQRAQQSV